MSVANSETLMQKSPGYMIDDVDYDLLRKTVLEILSIDLNCYRTKQMERRLTSLLSRHGLPSWQAYVERLRECPDDQEYLREYLMINVSSFYRDAAKWGFLIQKLLPQMMKKQRWSYEVDIWSAGCSIGAEPYTLSMVLNHFFPFSKYRIWATDIDPAVLGRAVRGGPYQQSEMEELPEEFRRKYLEEREERQYWVHPRLQKTIQFELFDLLQETTDRQFDLILCRNVVIYFVKDYKQYVHEMLANCLKPRGIIFTGSIEVISDYRSLGLRYIAPSFYQKG
jgi:chemotaxis protein methyltransferase CheR